MEDTMRISLAAARVNAGLTIKQAAERLGVNRCTLNKWELGHSSPTIEMAERISQVYNFPVEHIFFGKRLA